LLLSFDAPVLLLPLLQFDVNDYLAFRGDGFCGRWLLFAFA